MIQNEEQLEAHKVAVENKLKEVRNGLSPERQEIFDLMRKLDDSCKKEGVQFCGIISFNGLDYYRFFRWPSIKSVGDKNWADLSDEERSNIWDNLGKFVQSFIYIFREAYLVRFKMYSKRDGSLMLDTDPPKED